MAERGSAVIELDDAEDEFKFKDYGMDEKSQLNPSAAYTSFPDPNETGNIDERDELLPDGQKSGPSFWEFSYYQSFFNIDTDEVIRRIVWSMIPRPGASSFLQRHIRVNPDLYGPFWISTTLVFSIAISANIGEYLRSEGENKKIWHYDFNKVSFAATAIYSYVFLLPLAFYTVLWYRKSNTNCSLMDILCLYGYSLFIYIPISVIWAIQIHWLQWTLLIIGASLSGFVLVHALWSVLKEEKIKVAAVILILILVFHTLLAVGFLAYFFPSVHNDKIPVSLNQTASEASKLPLKLTSRDSAKAQSSLLKSAEKIVKADNLTEEHAGKHKISTEKINLHNNLQIAKVR